MSEEKKEVFLPAPGQRVSDEMRLQGANYYNPIVWSGMIKLAKTLIDAKAVPDGLDTEAKVLVALEAGREIGISPINALNSFYIVKGKVSIYGDTAIALVLRDGHQVDWGVCDAKEANVAITRGDNGKKMEAKFTYADAERKGLTKYDNGKINIFWTKYPENMLKFKAFGSIARFIVADSLRGMSIKEELEGDGYGTYQEAEILPAADNTKQISAAAEVKTEQKPEDEAASLQEFVAKEEKKPEEPKKKRTKAELVKDINKLCLDHDKDPKKLLAHYKKKTWLTFSVEQLEKVEESVLLSIKTQETDKDKLAALKQELAMEEENLRNAEEHPTETAQFYKGLEKTRQRVNNLREDIAKLEPKSAPAAATEKPLAEKPEEEEIPTYYMPDEDTLDKVNELLAKDTADLTQQEQNLLNDVGEDKFLGEKNERYKGIFNN